SYRARDCGVRWTRRRRRPARLGRRRSAVRRPAPHRARRLFVGRLLARRRGRASRIENRHRRGGLESDTDGAARRPAALWRARYGPPAERPTRTATTAWRWRSRSRRSRPSVPRRSAAPTPSSSRIPTSSTRSGGWSVKADKIYLVGFMAAGKTTLARALAKRL